MDRALDAELLAAHAVQDVPRLIALYTQAADGADDEAQAGFFLTHAYVFALEAGAPEAEELAERLRRAGRL